MKDQRRQFERLSLSEDAIALDSAGFELGRVAQAGGGGFLIYPATPGAAEKLKVGNRLRITVLEPKTRASNTVNVEVRYRDGKAFGCQFVAGDKP